MLEPFPSHGFRGTICLTCCNSGSMGRKRRRGAAGRDSPPNFQCCARGTNRRIQPERNSSGLGTASQLTPRTEQWHLSPLHITAYNICWEGDNNKKQCPQSYETALKLVLPSAPTQGVRRHSGTVQKLGWSYESL